VVTAIRKDALPATVASRTFSVRNLAKAWGCSDRVVYELIYSGKLKAFALNPDDSTRKGWRIAVAEAEAFEARRGSLNIPPERQ
jgi:hypothetical protein